MENKNQHKKYYIETYGCQMNEYDSLIAKKILDENNGVYVDSPEQADVILINTCAVRENAHTKIEHRLDALAHLTKQGKDIAVLGCLAQSEHSSLLQHKAVRYVFGPDSFRLLPKVFEPKDESTKEQKNESTQRSYLTLSKEETYEDVMPNVEHHLSGNNKTTAFVSIQRGCDNFCTFCVVPFTRGRERSKSPAAIIEEIQNLVSGGVKSVVLLGQNVNSYKYDSQDQNIDFTTLIEKILQATKIELIFFTSPHPKDFPKKLIDLIATEKRLANYLHIPLQSGSDEILQAMHRDYTKKDFLALVKLVREKINDVVISTDVIVGFPNETDEDFQETLEAMELSQFDNAFMFAYSERKGTAAQKKLSDNVSNETKQKRLQEIIRKQMKRSNQRSQNYVGKTVDVLAETVSRRNPNELVGKMRNSRKVVFSQREANQDKQSMLGHWHKVKIESATSMTLVGHKLD